MNFFNDGSKLRGKVGGVVFCKELLIMHSFKLPDQCSVLQVVEVVTKVAVHVHIAPK